MIEWDVIYVYLNIIQYLHHQHSEQEREDTLILWLTFAHGIRKPIKEEMEKHLIAHI